MKCALFIDRDPDIREIFAHNFSVINPEGFEIQIASSLDEAQRALRDNKFDGIIIDAITPQTNNIFPFIQKVHNEYPEIPITALVGFIDMKVDDKLKANLIKEGIKIVDKIRALDRDNFITLLQSCCILNNGE